MFYRWYFGLILLIFKNGSEAVPTTRASHTPESWESGSSWYQYDLYSVAKERCLLGMLKVIATLSIVHSIKTQNDSVTCDFEKDFCGWKSLKTLARQDGLVCGLRKSCWHVPFGPKSCERMVFYRNHVKWKRQKRRQDSRFINIYGTSIWSEHLFRPYKINRDITHVSDLLSEKIPLSFSPRCLKYRFGIAGMSSLLVAYTEDDHDFFNLRDLGLHRHKWTYVNTGINRLNRGLVELPVGRTFKVVFRVIYQQWHYGGMVFVDDITLSKGPCLDICESGEFKCNDGVCINSTKVCDSVSDCEDRSDEYDCDMTVKNEVFLRSCEPSTVVGLSSNCKSPIILSSFERSFSNRSNCYNIVTIGNHTLNDTSTSCYLKCPDTCVCIGLSFKCSTSQVPEVARSIDISGVNVPGNQFKLDDFIYIVHLKLQKCGLTKFKMGNNLKKLQTLDLSDNYIKTIDIIKMKKLVVLKLNNNPLLYSNELMQHIKNIQLTEIRNASFYGEDLDFGKHLYDIDFSHNNFSNTVIHSDSWDATLNLSHCLISNLSQSYIDCHTLDLSFNSIEYYFVPRKIPILYLQNNRLKEFLYALDPSKEVYLSRVYLQNNEITRLKKQHLQLFPSLIYINLKNNLISEINDDVFITLFRLVFLDLSDNKIRKLSKKSFSGLVELLFLFLTGNEIKEIDSYVFSSLVKLVGLDLSNNKVKLIQPHSFAGLINVKNLSVKNNNFRVQQSLFDGLSVLEYLEVDDYTICCARPVTVRKDRCIAPTNDISSCDQLIDVPILAVCIWYMALLAIFGNIGVLIYRCVTWNNTRCKTQAIFTINLSFADFMMGVYLYILALTNLYYTGMYGFADFDWRHGTTCKLAGVLATVSSESSAIHVFLITLDRVIVIKTALRGRKLTKSMSKLLVCFAWGISFLIAIVPVIENEYFHSFYSNSGVCISLPLSVIRKPGWQYSMVIFIGFNFILFLGILVGQIIIFVEVLKSGSAVQNSQTRKRELSVAKTLFAVVLTDVFCWIPIGIIGIITFFGVDVSSQIYAWIVVLVLPLNSALNPILYTFVIVLRKKDKVYRRNTDFESTQSIFSTRL